MDREVIAFAAFSLFIAAMMAVDLGLFHRKTHEVKIREALLLTSFWVTLAVVFGLGIYGVRGPRPALEFFTGYLIEECLSVDNLFVFLLIFSYFSVPRIYQHKVLVWGIVGVMLLRAVFIVSGVALIRHFEWILYVFGGILILSGVKLFSEKDKKIEPEKNPLLKFFKRLMPVTPHYEEDKFFVKRSGRMYATPLFVVLLVIETTDVIFAVDSIPAIFAITLDPFIVFTSNIFAVLGLRAMFFVLSGMMEKFQHLHYGLSFILVFVGVKMLVHGVLDIPVGIALGVIALTLALSVAASLLWPEKGQE